MTHAAQGLRWERYPVLAASRRQGLAIERRARAALASLGDALAGVETIAFAGSLGRLEPGPDSDIDCLVVTRAAGDPYPPALADALAGLGLKPSKPWGIYRKAVGVEELLDRGALGSLTEKPEVFGKRLQVLLDARPVYGEHRFETLRREVLDWYGTGFLHSGSGRGWTYLINDLVRYLHAYAAWQQYKFDRSEDDSWYLRQAKLRSTRIPTIAALLLLLGESSARPDKQAWLRARLPLTPFERVHAVMTQHDRPAFEQFAAAYERCHAELRDPAVRATLVAAGPDAPFAAGPCPLAAFESVRRLSGELIGTLTRFVLDRRGTWDDRFFERLVF